jgi:hypothetical protein
LYWKPRTLIFTAWNQYDTIGQSIWLDEIVLQLLLQRKWYGDYIVRWFFLRTTTLCHIIHGYLTSIIYIQPRCLRYRKKRLVDRRRGWVDRRWELWHIRRRQRRIRIRVRRISRTRGREICSDLLVSRRYIIMIQRSIEVSQGGDGCSVHD